MTKLRKKPVNVKTDLNATITIEYLLRNLLSVVSLLVSTVYFGDQRD